MKAASCKIIADLLEDLGKIDKDVDALIAAEHTNCTGSAEEYLHDASYHLGETIVQLQWAAGE
jgi:hypothetical protein